VIYLTKIHESLQNALADQLGKRLYAIPVLLSLGIGLYFAWGSEPTFIRPALTAGFLLAFYSWLRAIDHGGQEAYTLHRLIIMALFWVVLGFTAAKLRTEIVWSPILDRPLGPTGITGTINALEPIEGGKGTRLIIRDLYIRDLTRATTPHALRLTVRKGDENLQAGQRISVFAKVDPSSLPTTPGGFDFRRDAYFKQIGGYGYVLGSPRILNQPVVSDWWPSSERLRNGITKQVTDALPPRQAAVVAALLTGERAAIAEDDWQALRDSGLAHLLAISGANVDMVALIVFFVVRLVLACIPPVALYHPIKKYAAVAAFCAALAYVLLIYPSTPTMRAMLTVTIVLLAVLLDRSPISLRLVCFTAALVLLVLPEQLLSPSFQLSFAAVTALVAVFEALGPWLKNIHRDAGFLKRLIMYVVGVCGTTVIATLATAPISLFHFQTLGIYAVIANMLAVPIMTFIMMPLALLTYGLMPLGFAGPVLQMLGLTSDWILQIAHGTADLPYARFSPPAIPFGAFVMIVTAGVVICLSSRSFKLAAILPIIIAVIIVLSHYQPNAMMTGDGKLIMVKQNDGTIHANTRRAERRLQGDWAQYWGIDAKNIQRVPDLSRPTNDTLNPDLTYAIYGDKAVPVYQGGQGRLWQTKTPNDPS
jgi:competence protein ComEC